MNVLQLMTDSVNKLLKMRLAEQDAKIRLILCLKDDRVDFIFDEVDRRARVIRRAWRSTRVVHTKTARHAALDSVYNDVVRGYLI